MSCLHLRNINASGLLDFCSSSENNDLVSHLMSHKISAAALELIFLLSNWHQAL